MIQMNMDELLAEARRIKEVVSWYLSNQICLRAASGPYNGIVTGGELMRVMEVVVPLLEREAAAEKALCKECGHEAHGAVGCTVGVQRPNGLSNCCGCRFVAADQQAGGTYLGCLYCGTANPAVHAQKCPYYIPLKPKDCVPDLTPRQQTAAIMAAILLPTGYRPESLPGTYEVVDMILKEVERRS